MGLCINHHLLPFPQKVFLVKTGVCNNLLLHLFLCLPGNLFFCLYGKIIVLVSSKLAKEMVHWKKSLAVGPDLNSNPGTNLMSGEN